MVLQYTKLFSDLGFFTSFCEIEAQIGLPPILEGRILKTRNHPKGHVPILYKKVNYEKQKLRQGVKCNDTLQEAHVAASVTYHDLSAFLGRNLSTTFYREKNGVFFPVRTDSMVYAVQAPSIRDGLLSNPGLSAARADTLLGREKEDWNYTHSLDCKNPDGDKCKDAYPKVYGHMNVLSQSVSLVRYPVFVTETVTRSGFNNKSELLQRTTNHAFDPLTGNPTVTVARSPLDEGREARKATRVTPHWHLAGIRGTLASEMFERNMVAQNFLEEIFAWDTVETTLLPTELPQERRRNVSVSPYGKLPIEGVPDPLLPVVALGSFTSKKDPASLDSASLLAYQDETPSLDAFQGTRILKVDSFYKVLETEDALGRRLSSHFSSDGLYQTGSFYPAPHAATALWTEGAFPSEYQISGLAGRLVVEFQASAGAGASLGLSYGNETRTLPLEAGLKSYRVLLGESASGKLTLSRTGNAELRYLRAYPEAAEAKTFLYDRYGSVAQIVDEHNNSTYFEYDALGNLQQVRDHDGLALQSHHREWMNKGEEP
jgi:YD repeat-containing protein